MIAAQRGVVFVFTPILGLLQRQHVGGELTGILLREGIVVAGQQAVVERALQLFDPAVVKIVKNSRADAGPVVDGQGSAFRDGIRPFERLWQKSFLRCGERFFDQ